MSGTLLDSSHIRNQPLQCYEAHYIHQEPKKGLTLDQTSRIVGSEASESLLRGCLVNTYNPSTQNTEK